MSLFLRILNYDGVWCTAKKVSLDRVLNVMRQVLTLQGATLR